MPTIWDLAVAGGYFMIPIAICSIVVVAFALERWIGLRPAKILPPDLLQELERLNSDEKGLDPRQAYKLCQKHKSPLANVIRSAILKVGRPHAEVEKTVEDAVAREASLMAANIRPINVCASIAPLLGLLGTVQGMIMAFMVTSTTTATGTAKAQELAQGIYTALVTTFAGLSVAILAVLCAHYLEGSIERLLRDMEELFLEILPQFERYEGKLRVTRRTAAGEAAAKSVTGEASDAKAASKTPAEPQPTPPEPDYVPNKGLWSLMEEHRREMAADHDDEPVEPRELPGQSGVVLSGRKQHAK